MKWKEQALQALEKHKKDVVDFDPPVDVVPIDVAFAIAQQAAMTAIAETKIGASARLQTAALVMGTLAMSGAQGPEFTAKRSLEFADALLEEVCRAQG